MSSPKRLRIILKRKRSSSEHEAPVHQPESAAPSSSCQAKVEVDDPWLFTGSFANNGSVPLRDKVIEEARVNPNQDRKKVIPVDEEFQAKICREFGIDCKLTQIGKGGFGTVFFYNEDESKKGEDGSSSSKKPKTSEETSEKVKKLAIKVIPFRYKSTERLKLFHRQIKRELHFMRKLKDNANIGQLLDYKWIPGPEIPRMHMAIKTEWLDCSLKDILDSVGGVLNKEQFGHIAGPITSAVACIHENLIAHHDIKPDNIMLHPIDLQKPLTPQLATCQKKIIDFGVSRHYPNVRLNDARTTGHRAGTQLYFSPQKRYLKSYKDYNPYLADSYALGLTLLLTLMLAKELDNAMNEVDANGNKVQKKKLQEIVLDFKEKNDFNQDHMDAIYQLVSHSEEGRSFPRDVLRLLKA